MVIVLVLYVSWEVVGDSSGVVVLPRYVLRPFEAVPGDETFPSLVIWVASHEAGLWLSLTVDIQQKAIGRELFPLVYPDNMTKLDIFPFSNLEPLPSTDLGDQNLHRLAIDQIDLCLKSPIDFNLYKEGDQGIQEDGECPEAKRYFWILFLTN